MSSKAKKVWSVLGKALTAALFVFSAAVMIFTIVSVATVDKNDRSIFGYKAYIVMSDSMKDTFAAGDIVISKSITDDGSLAEGTIITFVSEAPDSFGQTVTHKIRRATVYNGAPAYVTYGTATGADDRTPVPAANVIGVYSFRLPKLGYFFNFLKTPAGYVCVILLPFLLVIVLNSAYIVRMVRGYRKDKAAAAAAAAEDENRRLREEMEALRARLRDDGKE